MLPKYSNTESKWPPQKQGREQKLDQCKTGKLYRANSKSSESNSASQVKGSILPSLSADLPAIHPRFPPTSWGLQHKPSFTFPGPLCRDSPDTFLALVALNLRRRSRNPFTLRSFKALKPNRCDWFCQIRLLTRDGEQTPSLNYICISFGFCEEIMP